MNLHYLKDLWDDSVAAGLDEPDLLTYRSNLLGRDLRLTNFGGGNTSAKLDSIDPITGETVSVLWVKGSGGDLGTIKRDGFATLYMDKLEGLKKLYRGVEFEDEIVDLYPLCTFNNNPRAASIDTPLHSFVPFPHVDHLHPDWAIALAACANGPAQLERLESETGLKLVWLPWKRPGFELGFWLQRAVEENAGIDGIILGSHGIFTWGNTGRESYLSTIRVIDGIGKYVLDRVNQNGSQLFGGIRTEQLSANRTKAIDLMPLLRGAVNKVIGHFSDSETVLTFVNSARAEALAWQGTSCPDHFVRTKVRPLYLPITDSSPLETQIDSAMANYRKDYELYYGENCLPDSPALRNANPSVVLIPGVGMFSFGKNKAEARITGEFYTNAINVMAGATSLGDLPVQDGIPADRIVDNYVALPPREAFNIEYWLLEEAKLKRMPAEKELSRKIALVIGASPGIGLATAERLCKEGAHVVIADINIESADNIAGQLQSKYGNETALSAQADCTSRESVQDLLDFAILNYGGVDILVQTAAIFIPPDEATGRTTDDQWKRTYDVNLFGSYVAADEVCRLIRKQGTSGSIVLMSSANGVVAKKGSLAYDTAKAALNHLIREISVEYAPNVRVNGVAPASVVEGSIQFPRERVMSSLTKYAITFEESESTESLRDKLSGFYAGRTMLKRKVGPTDVAEAAFLLASSRLGATTGQIIAVDAGLTEAFLR